MYSEAALIYVLLTGLALGVLAGGFFAWFILRDQYSIGRIAAYLEARIIAEILQGVARTSYGEGTHFANGYQEACRTLIVAYSNFLDKRSTYPELVARLDVKLRRAYKRDTDANR